MPGPQLFIDGEWSEGHGAAFDSIAPHDQSIVWSGRAADAGDVDRAFTAARKAFDARAGLDVGEREVLLRRYADQLKTQSESLARTIACEVGKPLWEARTEVAAMIGKIEISIRAYHQRSGLTQQDTDFGRHELKHKPHGVVAVFGPYNFPGHLPNGHIVPALLAGNAVVFKPSEQTPMVGEQMLRLWQQAGLPAGVLNLLPQLDGLYFTGSSHTGALLHRQFAGDTRRILALEMGGNNPLIVRELAGRDAAVLDVIQSAFITSGQRCTCARRLFVPQGSWGDAFVERLLQVGSQLAVGAWDAEPQPYLGPLISAAAADQLLAAQHRLQQAGGRALLALRRLDAGPAFLAPGIIDMSRAHHPPDKEFFGPLLQLYRYAEFDEALARANDTRYGLAAGLLSDSEDDYHQFWRRIRAGIVNWNRPTTGASGSFPFGGIGASGNHRPSAFYAADYCAYPVASALAPQYPTVPQLPPGVTL